RGGLVERLEGGRANLARAGADLVDELDIRDGRAGAIPKLHRGGRVDAVDRVGEREDLGTPGTILEQPLEQELEPFGCVRALRRLGRVERTARGRRHEWHESLLYLTEGELG